MFLTHTENRGSGMKVLEVMAMFMVLTVAIVFACTHLTLDSLSFVY